MYWYRLECGLGRSSVVGTTVRRAELPEHLLADEHHQTRDGEKNYIATTVGEGCCPGGRAGRDGRGRRPEGRLRGLQGRGPGRRSPEYAPRTVSVDGWASTHQAWLALFPLVVLLRCFLHGWLNIRSRGKLSESFAELSRRVWEAYTRPSRRGFAQRLRRLREWARGERMSAWLLEQVEKLCGRSKEYAEAYSHPGGHRTSNMLDRVMRGMNRYFDDGQHLHGSRRGVPTATAGRGRCCANFTPWHPATARANEGWRCPAERLNRHRYHDDWLQNLLISASLGGYRRRLPPKIRDGQNI